MGSGKVVKANFSAPTGLLGKIDDEFIKKVREESGYKLTRSSLIQVFFELAIEHIDALEAQKIFDQNSFKHELERAIKKQE